jgi:hypothetical protein
MLGNRLGRTTARKVVNGLTSLSTALLVFGATPAVLVTLVGNPLGHGLGHQWGYASRIALALLAAVAWVAWAVCCTQLGRAVVVQVRRGTVSIPAGAVWTERLAGWLAGGILSLMALATPLAVASGAGATGAPAAVGARPATHVTAAPVAPATSAMAPAVAAPAPAPAPAADPMYVVRPGDSLWSIAKSQLGDGGDWPAIAALNLGRTMADGLTFVDPSRIYAGWSLVLPDSATPPAAEAAAVAPTPVVAPVAAPTPPPPPVPFQSTRPRQMMPAEWDFDGTAPPVLRAAATPHVLPTDPGTPRGDGSGHANLPELVTLGIGALACAALTRRARRMRLLRDAWADELPTESPHAEAAIDADVLLASFSGVPALDALEAANCALARALGPDQGAADDVRIRAICVGAAGVDFWLAEPDRPAPAGFSLSADGAVWRSPHDGVAARATGRPYFPIVLPVGEDDAGTWLIPLGPGDCLPLVGEGAAALWRAACSAQRAWSWSDLVVVTDSAQVVEAEIQLWGGQAQPPDGSPQILFFGDPGTLPGQLTQAVSTVTLSQVPASDLVVLVDRRAASIHPLGRTVRPHLMDEATFAAVSQLTASPFDGSATEAGPIRPVAPEPAPRVAARPALRPRLVLVRLLRPMPRIEGLAVPLPSNRERRAVELVSYLALRQGEVVTSDQLRTRVLGSSDADAASSTLSNIATYARTALGLDEAGRPLLPPGSRTGQFRVSEAVSVDVRAAAELASRGGAATDPEEAMDLLQGALSFVEGEPLSLIQAGYSWWEAEGHRGQIAAVLVNAAGTLAELAVEAEQYDLAHWGLEQARLLNPYSEQLSRTAMRVAAAAGDADRLRQEWHACQRRMVELDPGGSPTEPTERLFGTLIRQLSANGTS